jgi:3-hydroxybutyrate dehydrogenase
MSLEGKCALITGSVQGLGLAAASRFAQAGCDIILNGFAEPERVTEIRDELESSHGVRTLYCGADLRRPREIEEMVAASSEEFGGIDILVNNAVVRHSAPVEEFPIDKWDESLAVNLSAAFHTIRLALPEMRRKNWGRIINVSSIYGLRGTINRIGYVTTKTALLGMTRAVALETLTHNITCNAICPGTTETPIHDATIHAMMAADGLSWGDAERRFLEGKQPTGRFVAADKVAALMLFLCGPESSDVTGAALPVDGGWAAS